jgi:hypothetical protein
MMHRRFSSESSRFPDTLQKVVLDTFSTHDIGSGMGDIVRILFGTGVHSKEIEFAFRSWRDDPKIWENSWMERVVGLRGPW